MARASFPTRRSGTGRAGGARRSTPPPAFQSTLATISIQTPLIALAWEAVPTRRPTAGLPPEALDELKAHYDWLERRDPDGDGLITILFPDESGLDDSPKYDGVYGWMAHDRPATPGSSARRTLLGRHRITARTRPPRRGRAGQRLLRAVAARARRLLGEARGSARRARSRGAARALLGRAPRAVLRPRRTRRAPRPGLHLVIARAARAPDGLARRRARPLVEEHLLDRAATWPARRPVGARWRSRVQPALDRFAWRGPAWMTTAWLLVGGLRALGATPRPTRSLPPPSSAAATASTTTPRTAAPPSAVRLPPRSTSPRLPTRPAGSADGVKLLVYPRADRRLLAARGPRRRGPQRGGPRARPPPTSPGRLLGLRLR